MSSTDCAEFVADATGYFKTECLEVETIATRSSAKAIQQLAAGLMQLASSGMPDHLRGIEQGTLTKNVPRGAGGELLIVDVASIPAWRLRGERYGVAGSPR